MSKYSCFCILYVSMRLFLVQIYINWYEDISFSIILRILNEAIHSFLHYFSLNLHNSNLIFFSLVGLNFHFFGFLKFKLLFVWHNRWTIISFCSPIFLVVLEIELRTSALYYILSSFLFIYFFKTESHLVAQLNLSFDPPESVLELQACVTMHHANCSTIFTWTIFRSSDLLGIWLVLYSLCSESLVCYRVFSKDFE